MTRLTLSALSALLVLAASPAIADQVEATINLEASGEPARDPDPACGNADAVTTADLVLRALGQAHTLSLATPS